MGSTRVMGILTAHTRGRWAKARCGDHTWPPSAEFDGHAFCLEVDAQMQGDGHIQCLDTRVIGLLGAQSFR